MAVPASTIRFSECRHSLYRGACWDGAVTLRTQHGARVVGRLVHPFSCCAVCIPDTESVFCFSLSHLLPQSALCPDSRLYLARSRVEQFPRRRQAGSRGAGAVLGRAGRCCGQCHCVHHLPLSSCRDAICTQSSQPGKKTTTIKSRK